MSLSGKFTVWLVWVDDNGSYEPDSDIIDAFETEAQAYARKERLEKMLAAAKRRSERYLSAEGTEPPKHHGVVGELVSRFGVNARVWVHPLPVTRGTPEAR